MKLKTRILAFIAAGLLSIGLAGATALADSSNPTVTITLNGGTTTCSATSGSASFGTYNWVAGKYVYDTANPGKLTITVTVNEAYGDAGDTCDVSAYLGPLYNSGNSQLTIPVGLTSENTGSNFNSPNPLSSDSANPSTLATGLANGIAYSWDATDISSMLNAYQQPPGAYSGTLYLSSTVTAP